MYFNACPNRTMLGWRKESPLPAPPSPQGHEVWDRGGGVGTRKAQDGSHGAGALSCIPCPGCICNLLLCFGVQQMGTKTSKKLVPHDSKGDASPGTCSGRKANEKAVGHFFSLVLRDGVVGRAGLGHLRRCKHIVITKSRHITATTAKAPLK